MAKILDKVSLNSFRLPLGKNIPCIRRYNVDAPAQNRVTVIYFIKQSEMDLG